MEKNKIKDKIYVKIINSDFYLKEKVSDEHTFFKKASKFLKDEELEKLILRYEEFKIS